jgi:tRNA dimethylallyltransferase
VLRERIHQRFDAMLAQDFEAEVSALYQRGDLSADLPAMRAVGYRQMWSYLAGDVSYNEMKTQAIIATQQLAKRQLTWLRKEVNALWFDSMADKSMNEVLDAVLKYRAAVPK